MKKIERYVCEFCKAEYADEVMCANCEEKHHKPVKVMARKYYSYAMDRSGLPETVTVTMDNGAEIVYKRDSN